MQNLPIGVQELVLGQSRMQTEMLQNFIIAVCAGLLLVLAVLVLLYKRALPPLVNMGSLFLAPLGGLLALWLLGYSNSLPVWIGLLMLIGIVAKNSILLIDFALEEMDKGVPKYEAILDAGHKRAQPIVMTTVAMTAGMIPTAMALHGPDEFGQPMGWTVIGGLIVSTFLTLVLVPGTFSLALGIEERLGPKLKKWLTNGGADAPIPRDPSVAPQPAE
jgi:multidrug efflux pump subunit AcrB